MSHWVVLTDNNSNKKEFISNLIKGKFPPDLKTYTGKTGALFSSLTIDNIIEEESKRDYNILSTKNQSFETMSSGEQKRTLLHYLLASKPNFIILDNPFDNLDTQFQEELKNILKSAAKDILFIQLASRKTDALPFIEKIGRLTKSVFSQLDNPIKNNQHLSNEFSKKTFPQTVEKITETDRVLIEFKNVSISYLDKPILKDINWKIQKGDFWQLIGANGTGKTTLLSMIIGDNPKAFGQEIYLFGNKKGSGESVWDIKKKIGYYTPAMTTKFSGRHTVEYMLISGLTDSIGLYTIPTEAQKIVIKEWLALLNLERIKDNHYNTLSLGQQRLVMTARAMVKHPPILILDEPTAGMDDESASLLVELVNKIAKETETAILFVCHRKEPGLKPKMNYHLEKTSKGAIGIPKKV